MPRFFRFALPLFLVGLVSAQTVMPGMGARYEAYRTSYGEPVAAGDTLLDAQERIWKIRVQKSWGSDVNFQLHVFFRAGKSVEERWVRVGRDNWTKDELWHVLDGKVSGFKMIRRSEGTPSPYQSLDNSKGLLYFVVPDRSYGALLERSAMGPELRIANNEWAARLGQNGYGPVHRNVAEATLRSEAPRWGGLKETDMSDFTEKLGRRSRTSGRTWLLPASSGEVTWKTVASSVQVTVRINDVRTWQKWSSSTYAKRAAVKKDCFERFGAVAYQYLPKLIGNISWRTDRIDGALPASSSYGAVRLLESKGTIGEDWTLDLDAQGYLLQVNFPVGVVPGS